MSKRFEFFDVGEVVRLRSCHPSHTFTHMTVRDCWEHRLRDGPAVLVVCQWFTGGLLKEAEFDARQLVRVDPTPMGQPEVPA